MDSAGSEEKLLADSCEHRNETSVREKRGTS
jgi:hypothetical protein